jgi:hypothetical protein
MLLFQTQAFPNGLRRQYSFFYDYAYTQKHAKLLLFKRIPDFAQKSESVVWFFG